ncbi:hypothetical protein GGH94_001527 [Coemansia aciculifera]|uniref:Uncharacterized protein n=1 Tax=Coemansia aciculifera TaxID=417176 RepID=A0A9W8ILL5_9FUNG|nr:hypothetical protein GGH94_001527 [Coemansia aciculifera]KAJ2876429.1 hypothetical protein GGH93_000746 [Coemansia aciculifera]
MAILWYTARIMPFSDSFNTQVKACLRNFIWNGRQSKVEWDVVILPKTQGSLGLLPFEKQTQAIFTQFTANMFRQKDPPWWAATAQRVFDQWLGQKNMHSFDLLATAPPKGIPKALPACWDRVLRTWYALKGKGPDETFNGSIETLLGLPFEHPAVYLLIKISGAVRKRLRANKLFTLGDIFVRYEPTGAATSRDDPLLQPYVLAFGQCRINLHPHVVRKLLNYPLDPDRRTVCTYAQLGSVPLEAYTPREGRLTAISMEVTPIKLEKT